MQKLPPPKPQHLLYIEDHAEILRVEITADIRYMFNIDPRLPSTTLIDSAAVTNLDRAYQKMHEEGASIRLCIYDASRGRHFSMYGPKIKGRGGMRYPLGNRPNNLYKANVSAAPSPARSPTKAEKDAFIKAVQTAPSPTRPTIQADKEAQVSKWIDEIPTHGTIGPLENDRPLSATEERTQERGIKSSSNTSSSDKIIDKVRLITSDPEVPEDKKERLRTLVHELVKSVDRTNSPLSQPSSNNQDDTPYLSGPSSPLPYDEIVKQAIDEDRPVPVKKPGVEQMPKKTDPRDAKGGAKVGGDSPSQAPGALETKPIQPPLTWSMAPLVPVPVRATVGTVPSIGPVEGAKTDNDENQTPFQRYHESGTSGFSTMDQQGGNARKLVTSASTGQNIGTRPQDLALQHPLTQDFPKEMNQAIRTLLEPCPYKRGTVTVRADFGRIILGGMDQSAMAFNNAKTPSNGWKKSDLLKNLNEQVVTRERIHFTKILSTYGSDLEDMINMTDGTGGQTNNRMWQPVPRESWVVYSFRCIYREDKTEFSYLINCRYGPDGKDFTYEIRPFNSTNDGVTPIYAHDLLRSWDLRITLTHFDSPLLEKVLGRATRKFLKSVKISQVTSNSSVDSEETIRVTKTNRISSKFEAEGIDLQFSIGDERMYVQEVRVLTKWRYSNFQATSELEITEVVPLVTTPVPGRKIRTYLSQLPPKKDNRIRLSRGMYPRWYEASVVSTAMEKVFKENEKLPFAEKASWSIETLENFQGHNALCAIYEPALQMLKQMDHVGGNECNNMPQDPQYEVRRRNDKQDVPGLAQATPVTSPPPGGPRPGGHVQQISSASARGPPSVARARWDARMEDVEKKGGTFW